MELMDQMEAALSARLRSLRLLEEGMASGEKGGCGVYNGKECKAG